MLDSLDPKFPIAATVDFKVDQAKEGTFRGSADLLTEATRKMPGMKVFGYHKRVPIQREQETPNVVEYFIYQEWETVAQFRGQWGFDHLKHFMFTVFDLLVAMP